MATHERWHRIAAIAALTAGACLAAYVPIRHRMQRLRMEELRDHIKAANDRSNTRGEVPTVANVPLWIIARDSQYVAVAETVGSARKAPSNQRAVLMSFKLTKVLKGVSLVGVQESAASIKAEGSHESCPVLKAEAVNYPPGSNVLILFNKSLLYKANTGRPTCLVMPDTKENASAVEKGISSPDSHFR